MLNFQQYLFFIEETGYLTQILIVHIFYEARACFSSLHVFNYIITYKYNI